MTQKESYVLVITEAEVAGKKRIIESILGKLTTATSLLISPVNACSDVVRNWCSANEKKYATVEDQKGGFVEWCDFGIFFTNGPEEASFRNVYRQAFRKYKKLAFIIEVNSEAKNNLQEKTTARSTSRDKEYKQERLDTNN